MRLATIAIACLAVAGCEADRLPTKIVCTGRDGSRMESSVEEWWGFDSRGNVYSTYGEPPKNFTPRPGDECESIEVKR